MDQVAGYPVAFWAALATVAAATMGIVSALVSAFVSNFLASRRTLDEKLWEARREAYGLILSQYAIIARTFDIADKWLARDPMGYFEHSASDKHSVTISECRDKIVEHSSKNYVALSAEFTALYEDERGEYLNLEYEGEYLHHESTASIFRKYRRLLVNQARKEIRTHRRRPWDVKLVAGICELPRMRTWPKRLLLRWKGGLE